jgi:hypothetical protein
MSWKELQRGEFMKKIIIAVCLAVLLLACGCRIKGIVTAGNTY